MPEQFVKVKEPHKSAVITSREAFASDLVIKHNDFYKCDTDSNYSNSVGDICRICHCEADAENPLLSPCYCSGSLKYVHQSCLRQWLAASDSRTCELCKFNFILHTKIKPLSEWRILEMSSVEKRKLMYVVSFNFVAAVCVIWSLFVLIDRTAEEFRKGVVGWPFWTKLGVVAIGFTGGAVFMYLYCKKYMMLLSRWRAHNRIILVQNAPERPSRIIPQQTNPNFLCSKDITENLPIVITQPNNAFDDAHPFENSNVTVDAPNNEAQLYKFLNQYEKSLENDNRTSSIQKADVHVEDLCETPKKSDRLITKNSMNQTNYCLNEMEYLKARELAALDIECLSNNTKIFINTYKTDNDTSSGSGGACKSLPNLLSSSNENLLV